MDAHWGQDRKDDIPVASKRDWAAGVPPFRFMESDHGPVCIEVEDDTCAGSLAGRQQALRVAGKVLRPFLP